MGKLVLTGRRDAPNSTAGFYSLLERAYRCVDANFLRVSWRPYGGIFYLYPSTSVEVGCCSAKTKRASPRRQRLPSDYWSRVWPQTTRIGVLLVDMSAILQRIFHPDLQFCYEPRGHGIHCSCPCQDERPNDQTTQGLGRVNQHYYSQGQDLARPLP